LRLAGLVLIYIGLRIRARTTGVIGTVIVMVAFVLVGHTATHPDRWVLGVSLLVHLLVVAFWFGALFPLYRLSMREPPAVAGRIVADFSAVAVWLVPAVLVAALILAVVLLPDLAALRTTTYGQLLIAKMVGFALLMLLASLNKFRYGPALQRGDRGAVGAFRRTVLTEYVLIAAILCVTATLTTFFSPDD
jgi:putative copper export protein